MERAPRKTRRLDRDEWLSRALEVLSSEGEGKLRIDRLAAALAVTKGSFYWHFRDRADFVRSLAEHWRQATTEGIFDEVSSMSAGPRERLRRIIEIITRGNYGRYELAMRTWASHEPDVAPIVKQVDSARVDFVRSIFAELGFGGDELEARTRIFVCFFSLELGLFVRESRKERLQALERRLEFFTKP